MQSRSPNLRRDALLVGAANLLSRATGLLREVAFAAAFGATAAADAYNAAFRIGNLLRELFAEGALSNAFVPLYARVQEREGQESAWRLANAFLGVLLALVGALTLATALLAEPLVQLVASGYAGEKAALTASLTRVMSPFVATLAIASVWMGMLNVRGRFFGPAMSPALFNGAVIAACLGAPALSARTGVQPILWVALASLIGGVAQALFQLPALLRAGYRPRPSFRGHPALRSLVAFVGPAVVAISVVQLHLLIETQLASREGDGPVSWLLYAFRVAHLPFSLISGALGVASLAGLSVHAARGDHAAFRRDLSSALNMNSLLLFPATIGLWWAAEPIVALFFERGAFTAHDTQVTASLLRAYAVAILAIGAQRILVPVFYTLNDPRTPMWVGVGALTLKVPLALGLMGAFGLQGLPLSHAALATLEVVALIALLQRRVGGLALAGAHLRALACGAVMIGALFGLQALLHPAPESRFGAFAVVIAAGLAYLVAAELLGLRVLSALLPKRRGLPPSIDAETRAALSACARAPIAAPRWEDGRAVLETGAGRLTLSATGGTLTARLDPGPAGDAGASGDAGITAVLRVGGGPPRLIGLQIAGENPVNLRAEGDSVVIGEAEGVKVRVEP